MLQRDEATIHLSVCACPLPCSTHNDCSFRLLLFLKHSLIMSLLLARTPRIFNVVASHLFLLYTYTVVILGPKNRKVYTPTHTYPNFGLPHNFMSSADFIGICCTTLFKPCITLLIPMKPKLALSHLWSLLVDIINQCSNQYLHKLFVLKSSSLR